MRDTPIGALFGLAVFLQTASGTQHIDAMELLENDRATSPSWREELLNGGISLVKKIAFTLARRLPATVDVADLEQAGYLGLLAATRKFDPEQEVRFATYATPRIRGAMLDSLRDADWVPRAIRKRQREWRNAAARLATKLGRTAEEEELREEIGLTQRQLQAAHPFGPVEPTLVRTDGDGLGAVAAPGETPQEQLEQKEIRDLLAKAIEGLPDRERLVIALYYYEELAMKEIGRVLGVNESRVSQIHGKALRRLRVRVRQHLRPEPLPLPSVREIAPRAVTA